jgi:hypothetical protein
MEVRGTTIIPALRWGKTEAGRSQVGGQPRLCSKTLLFKKGRKKQATIKR